MNADMRAIYVAGAYDALIAFAMSNQQRPSTPIIATKSSLAAARATGLLLPSTTSNHDFVHWWSSSSKVSPRD